MERNAKFFCNKGKLATIIVKNAINNINLFSFRYFFIIIVLILLAIFFIYNIQHNFHIVQPKIDLSKQDDIGERLHLLRQKVKQLIKEYQIDKVILEDIYMDG